jgi:hypothetical protein
MGYANTKPTEPEKLHSLTLAGPSTANASVIEFPATGSERTASPEVTATLNEIRQTLTQLGENYLKLHAASFPVTDCRGLATILGKSEGTIRRWTDANLIPYYKIPTGEKFTYLYNLKRVEAEFDERYLHEAEV